MKRAFRVTALLAMGLLVASSFAAAQEVAVPKDFLFGQANISLMGRDSVDSSKFQEYRDLSQGVFGPGFSLVGSKKSIDFSLYGENIRQQDQHYFGQAAFGWGGITFDYNQTPHNMGTAARTILSETSDGVFSLSPTLRKTISGTIDATASTARTYPFYSGLLGPSLASANSMNISSLRQRGSVEFDLAQKLPFDLNFTYTRELKSGYRGQGGADIIGLVTSQVDIPAPLDEMVQDIGVRAAYNFKAGNVHASFNRNLYDNRAETLVIDNPLSSVDVAGSSGSPGAVRVINAPDNEASTGRFGVQLKFPKQTRITGDVGLATWTQNASFYPYTINSTVLTGTGQPANLASSLQQPSLNGKINTTTVNFGFMSRPAPGLAIRLRYRSYDMTNKTNRFVITGDTSNSPDRAWGAADAPNAEAPFGHPTANNYDSTNRGFTATVSYDIKGLTFEGVARTAKVTRTFRESTGGTENGYGFSALYHATDLVGIRATVDQAKRTADGQTIYGFQSDEAERKTTRTGLDLELTPTDKFSVSFAYFRRNVDYPDRPNRVQVSGGVPVAGAQPIPGTPSGLLGAKYDSYTTEIEFTPSARAELSAYYTYEKDVTTNQWSTTTGPALNNLMNFVGTDKTNSFGASALFHLVPEKWTLSLNARQQKVDGLLDITANPTGAFALGRTAVGLPAASDITDWDDTKITSGGAQIDYAVTKVWTFSVGYLYEKYNFGDAFTSGTSLLQPTVMIFLKPDNGNYKASLGYAKLSYKF